MNIIIVGAGKVGRELIEKFSKENHDITVIDEECGAYGQAYRGL